MSIAFVGIGHYFLYFPSSPLEPFTALSLARDTNLSSANIEV
jgi:hypothetical protein